MLNFLQQKLQILDPSNNDQQLFERFMQVAEKADDGTSSNKESIEINSDGLVMDEEAIGWDVIDNVHHTHHNDDDVPASKTRSTIIREIVGNNDEFDSLTVSASPHHNSLSANGFSLSTMTPNNATHVLNSTTSALKTTHNFMSNAARIKRRMLKDIELAVSELSEAENLSTPLMQPQSTLASAFDSLRSYSVRTLGAEVESVTFLEDALLPSLRRSLRVSERRSRSRSNALDCASNRVLILDKKLEEAKHAEIQKETVLMMASAKARANDRAMTHQETLFLKNEIAVTNSNTIDVSAKLLSSLSALDGCRRAARIFAESNLLSACGAQANALQQYVVNEKKLLTERLEILNELEMAVGNISPRKDISNFVAMTQDNSGYDENKTGGVASALALLAMHSIKEGGHSNDANESDSRQQLISGVDIDRFLKTIFGDVKDDVEVKEVGASIEILKAAVGKGGSSSSRAALCKFLNDQRSRNTRIPSRSVFLHLVDLFEAQLGGCSDKHDEDVSNFLSTMMFAQTFYYSDDEEGEGGEGGRETRVYLRSRLTNPKKRDETHWDACLFWLLSEAIQSSSVLYNMVFGMGVDGRSKKQLSWHNIKPENRDEAASQVHAIVFAQVSALVHSMMEFGVAKATCEAFIHKHSTRNGLSREMQKMLHGLINDET